MLATWDDSDSSDLESEKDECANVCFMTIHDEVINSEPNSSNFSFKQSLVLFDKMTWIHTINLIVFEYSKL